jgi:hypothetical protein
MVKQLMVNFFCIKSYSKKKPYEIMAMLNSLGEKKIIYGLVFACILKIHALL